VSGMIWSCVGVEDCELSEDVGVVGWTERDGG
jgi:hypothetical protein